MARFAPAVATLITRLSHLPGIGSKTAQRLAFHLLASPKEDALALAEAITYAREHVHLCSECFHLTETDPCDICTSTTRDRTVICVVEHPRDVIAVERMRDYQGLYHVLHGALSPTNGVGPESLRLQELIRRLQRHPEIEEVIVATNPTIEGEATALYLARLLRDSGIRTTRLAHGIPMGGDLEYADEATLASAFAGRQAM